MAFAEENKKTYKLAEGKWTFKGHLYVSVDAQKPKRCGKAYETFVNTANAIQEFVNQEVIFDNIEIKKQEDNKNKFAFTLSKDFSVKKTINEKEHTATIRIELPIKGTLGEEGKVTMDPGDMTVEFDFSAITTYYIKKGAKFVMNWLKQTGVSVASNDTVTIGKLVKGDKNISATGALSVRIVSCGPCKKKLGFITVQLRDWEMVHQHYKKDEEEEQKVEIVDNSNDKKEDSMKENEIDLEEENNKGDKGKEENSKEDNN